MADDVLDEASLLAHAGTQPGAVSGLVKLKLIHAQGYSLLLPDLIAVPADGSWKWIQPKFFAACMMHFLDTFAVCDLAVDAREIGPRLRIRFTSGQWVKRYADGSHLYRCTITGTSGAAEVLSLAVGTCVVSDTLELQLDLYHHTTAESKVAIEATGHFRASSWNVQGTKKLRNVGYAYFTSLPTIQTDADLQRIAMSSNGHIELLPTNGTPPADVKRIHVYREGTSNRRSTIKVRVPASAIASQHVYRHAPIGDAVYYEVCHPEIQRVGLTPAALLPLRGSEVQPAPEDLKRFQYVVLGDADTSRGLEAPYDEEDTKDLFIIEPCTKESIFDFWRANPNSDQVSGRMFERQVFQP